MKSLVTAACSKPLSQTRQLCHQPCWREAFRTWFHDHGRTLITLGTRKSSGNRTLGKAGEAGWRKSAARSSHPCECLLFAMVVLGESSPKKIREQRLLSTSSSTLCAGNAYYRIAYYRIICCRSPGWELQSFIWMQVEQNAFNACLCLNPPSHLCCD